MEYIRIILSFCVSLLSTFFLVPLCSRLAHILGVLDAPDGKIKKHSKPIPYLGGVAMYFGFLISLGLLQQWHSISFIGEISLFLFLGLVDDIVAMKPYQKFLGQIIIGCLLFKEAMLQNAGLLPANCLIFFVFLFWILLVTNAFNLVDVMDGLASTIASCATFSFFVIAVIFNYSHEAIILSAFLGSLVGFLYYNRPPALIYMGDAGSLYIGGFLAIAPFLFPLAKSNPFNIVIPIIILSIPILEVSTLVIIRSYKRIPFYRATPDHFCMYLRNGGWTKHQILLYVIIVASILLGLSLLFLLDIITIFSFLFFLIIFLVFWFLILKKNIYCAKERVL